LSSCRGGKQRGRGSWGQAPPAWAGGWVCVHAREGQQPPCEGWLACLLPCRWQVLPRVQMRISCPARRATARGRKRMDAPLHARFHRRRASMSCCPATAGACMDAGAPRGRQKVRADVTRAATRCEGAAWSDAEVPATKVEPRPRRAVADTRAMSASRLRLCDARARAIKSSPGQLAASATRVSPPRWCKLQHQQLAYNQTNLVRQGILGPPLTASSRSHFAARATSDGALRTHALGWIAHPASQRPQPRPGGGVQGAGGGQHHIDRCAHGPQTRVPASQLICTTSDMIVRLPRIAHCVARGALTRSHGR